MYSIRFYGGFFASPLFTTRGAHPTTLDEAIESAEEEHDGEAFEIWGPEGDYQSEAFEKEMEH